MPFHRKIRSIRQGLKHSLNTLCPHMIRHHIKQIGCRINVPLANVGKIIVRSFFTKKADTFNLSGRKKGLSSNIGGLKCDPSGFFYGITGRFLTQMWRITPNILKVNFCADIFIPIACFEAPYVTAMLAILIICWHVEFPLWYATYDIEMFVLY